MGSQLFGADKEFGVISDHSGNAQVVKVADVGESALIVHDEGSENPSIAFALSRLSVGLMSQPLWEFYRLRGLSTVRTLTSRLKLQRNRTARETCINFFGLNPLG